MTADDAGPSPRGLAGVVLAAGLGTRLRPLTNLRPKALCPIGGTPLLDLALQRLEPICGRGSERVAVNAHHHAEQVVAHVGERAFVSVEAAQPLGTAGALGRLRGWLAGRDVLLTNADAYLLGSLDELVEGWDGDRCRLLVVDTGEPSDFSTCRYVGACLLPWRLVSGLSDEPSGLYELLWRPEDDAGRLELVRFSGTAVDCGTPTDYLAANLLASGGESVVGEGAVVEGAITRCVVWDGAYVGPDEELVEVIRAGTRTHPLTVPASPHPPHPPEVR
ncbi:MAG: NTP transferase domain-containing protein [Actinomycetes bacterium]